MRSHRKTDSRQQKTSTFGREEERYLIRGRFGEPPGFKSRLFIVAVPVVFVIVLAGFTGSYLSVLPSPEWRSMAQGIWLCVNLLTLWTFFAKLYRPVEMGLRKYVVITGILAIAFGAISWNGLLVTVPWLMAKTVSEKTQVAAVMKERLMPIRGRCSRRISVVHGETTDRFDICLGDEPMPETGEILMLDSRRTWFGLVVDEISKDPR